MELNSNQKIEEIKNKLTELYKQNKIIHVSIVEGRKKIKSAPSKILGAYTNFICVESEVNKYMESFSNIFPFSVPKWNFSKLKQIQYLYFLSVILAICLGFGAYFMTQIEMDRISVQSVKEEIVFRDGSKAFSDVAVARILDIPIDVRDTKRLYHVTVKTEALHGADKSFDVYKTIEEGTTVRITGQTIDNKWLRVMFDNGEMAFIEANKLEKGIGKEIPLWSKIYKDE
jgi:uncharacterized pyridoxamine 5'-phosphate oxidase family protein